MIQGLKEKIVVLRQEGKTYKEIREIVKCAKSVISYHCRNAGLSDGNAGRKTTEDRIALFNELYLSGLSSNEIAKKLQCSKFTVLKYITVPLRQRVRKLTVAKSVVIWRQKRKKDLVEYKGGRCCRCGYDKCIDALTFHHVNPLEKEFNIGGSTYGFERLKKEVDKCILLCMNCHAEEHSTKNEGL